MFLTQESIPLVVERWIGLGRVTYIGRTPAWSRSVLARRREPLAARPGRRAPGLPTFDVSTSAGCRCAPPSARCSTSGCPPPLDHRLPRRVRRDGRAGPVPPAAPAGSPRVGLDRVPGAGAGRRPACCSAAPPGCAARGRLGRPLDRADLRGRPSADRDLRRPRRADARQLRPDARRRPGAAPRRRTAASPPR